MGAKNSTPSTVTMTNPKIPTDGIYISISPQVGNRVALAKQEYSKAKDSEAPGTPQNPVISEQPQYMSNTGCGCQCGEDEKKSKQNVEESQNELLYKSALELQEEQFNKTMNDLEHAFGKPVEWTDTNKIAIRKLRDDVLNCYKENFKEPLQCNKLAEDFQNYVFKEQLSQILINKEETEKEVKAEKTSDTNDGLLYRSATSSSCAGTETADCTTRDTGIKVSGDCRDPSDPPDLVDVKHEWKKNEQTGF